MYRIFIYDDLGHFTEADMGKAREILPACRWSKAMSYVHSGDRKRSVIASLLLGYALREVCSICRMPEICCGYHGKPRLSGEKMPRFNLSHCDLAVACAISDTAVGIDVEAYSSYCDEVAREVFSDREMKMAFRNPPIFAELWTRKESFLKYTGEGLTGSLKTILSETGEAHLRTFHFPLGYACSVCAGTINNDLPTFVDKTTLLNG